MRIHELTESSRQLQPYLDLMIDLGYFMSMNTAKLNSYAKDAASAKELTDMMTQFKKPILNDKTLFDLNSEPHRKTLRDPRVVVAMLKWVYQFLNYAKPRIERFANDQGRQNFLPRIEALSNQYRAAVKAVS